MFTHLEELTEVAKIPRNYLPRLAPLVQFAPEDEKSDEFYWKPINMLSVTDLMACGVELLAAERIVSERQRLGHYQSVSDIKQRTGLPLSIYRHLV